MYFWGQRDSRRGLVSVEEMFENILDEFVEVAIDAVEIVELKSSWTEISWCFHTDLKK